MVRSCETLDFFASDLLLYYTDVFCSVIERGISHWLDVGFYVIGGHEYFVGVLGVRGLVRNGISHASCASCSSVPSTT